MFFFLKTTLLTACRIVYTQYKRQPQAQHKKLARWKNILERKRKTKLICGSLAVAAFGLPPPFLYPSLPPPTLLPHTCLPGQYFCFSLKPLAVSVQGKGLCGVYNIEGEEERRRRRKEMWRRRVESQQSRKGDVVIRGMRQMEYLPKTSALLSFQKKIREVNVNGNSTTVYQRER